jgi:hypothetical protein
MQQFTVPQFIDVEDKVFGPITVRQFSILLAAFMLESIIYKFFDTSFFAFFGILIFVIAMVFAFLKINGSPFHFFILNFLQTLVSSKLRIWNNRLVLSTEEDIEIKGKIEKISLASHRDFTVSKLAELALIVDTQGAFRPGLNNQQITSLDEKNNFV